MCRLISCRRMCMRTNQAKDVFGTERRFRGTKMVYRSVKKVHDQIAASAFPKLPLIFSEYNASYANEPDVTDSAYMGPWLANNDPAVRWTDGQHGYWAFSDVFEEQGVVRTPYLWRLRTDCAGDGIPKPSLNVFRALHQLGDRRIALDSDSALATKLSAGGVAVALWNYAPPDGTGAELYEANWTCGAGAYV